jgi:ABC-type antimicrobial peptide transport system permease subunit
MLRLAADNIMMYIGQLIENTFVSMILFMLIAVLITVNGITSNLRSTIENSGIKSVEGMGYLKSEYALPDNILDYLNEISEIDGATYQWDLYETIDTAFINLRDIQKENKDEISDNDASLEIVCVDYSISSIWTSKICKGVAISELSLDTDEVPLYLGYEYNGKIDIGTKYKSDFDDTTYVVSGIFDKGVTMPEYDMYEMDRFNITEAYPLDYAVVAIKDFSKQTNQSVYFHINGTTSFDDAEQAITNRLEQEGCYVSLLDVGAKLSQEEKASKKTNENIIEMIILVGFTYFLLLICFQLASFIRRKRDFGIMISNGFSIKDIEVIILLENAVKYFIAVILSLLCSWFIVLKVLDPAYSVLFVLRKIIWEDAALVLGLIGIVLTFVTTLCPVIMFYRLSTVELMDRGE